MANLKKRRQQRAAAARAANNNNNNNAHDAVKAVGVQVPIHSHKKKHAEAAAAAAAVPRSVPSSPTQRPANADADAEPTGQAHIDQAHVVAAEQQQPEDEQQQQQQQADAPVPLSAEDEKHQSTLRDVCARLSAIEFELPVLRSQLSYHAARLAALRMGHFRSATLNEDKIRLSHNSLRYNMGMIDERTMHAIFRLDSIQTDNADIRKQRKATVARGHALIAESLKMRERMDRLARFLPKQKDEQQADEQSPAPSAKESEVPSTPAAEEAAMMQDEEDDDDEEEQEEQEERDAEMEEKYAEPAQPTTKPAEEHKQQHSQQQQQKQQQKHAPIKPKTTTTATATPAAAAPALHPFQRKYAPLALPSWEGPTFRSRVHPLTGSLLIETDLTGMLAEDVQVTNDPATRTLTIRGVKLPQARRSLPQRHAFGGFFGLAPARQLPVEPYGYWTKVINFNEIDTTGTLNLAGLTATLGANNTLEISIPRVPGTRKVAPAVQQQQRRPVHYSSGAAYSDDDDADMESHPYARYQQQRPVRRVAQPAYHSSPFFSNGWW